MSYPTHVTVTEVGPRDGLQIERAFWVDSAYLHIGILRKFRADCVKLKHRIDARLDG